MPIVAQQSAIFDYMDAFNETWCVYEHWIADDTSDEQRCIFIGVCELSAVYYFEDARRNSEWQKLVKPRTVLTVRITCTGSRTECFNHRGRMLAGMQPQPICNAQGYDLILRASTLICNETGARYRTQLEAAQALGVTQGAISQHLAGRVKRVKGVTLRKELPE